MRATKGRRSRRTNPAGHLGKAHGVFAPRVPAAGPEHFGILAIDPAKARSYAMLADFYGRVLIPVTVVDHTRIGFQEAVADLRRAIAAHGLRDLVVAIEQTGTYHRPIRDAYHAAGFETRIVHPSISRHFREAAAYDNKTDPTDLEGIFAPRSMASACSNPPGIRPTPPFNSWPATAATWSPSRPRSAARSWSTSRPSCQDTRNVSMMFSSISLHCSCRSVMRHRRPSPGRARTGWPSSRAWRGSGSIPAPCSGPGLGGQNAPAPGPDAALHRRLFGTWKTIV